MSPKDLTRFYKFIHRHESGCWLWKGCIGPSGYGYFATRNHKGHRAHRISFEHFNGLIPKGEHIHHTCENKHCVNPAHLIKVKPATHKWLHAKTHCKHGHEISGDNAQIERSNGKIRVRCRKCRHDKDNRRNQRPEVKAHKARMDAARYKRKKSA